MSTAEVGLCESTAKTPGYRATLGEAPGGRRLVVFVIFVFVDIEIPFIEIRKPRSFRPLDSALKNLHEYDWLILTSVNGIQTMCSAWKN